MIKNADYVLISAGTGMSTAAGARYGGGFFEENFGEFQQKYGKGQYMQDMYSAGFYPFPDEESYWGYWSKQVFQRRKYFALREIIFTFNVKKAAITKFIMQLKCLSR